MQDQGYVQLCECGCGNPAPISGITWKKKGYVKGQPMRFICGHYSKTAAHRGNVAEKLRGRRDPVERRIERLLLRSYIALLRPDIGACWINPNKANLYAGHRLSYEFFLGPIPDDKFVLHKCDVKACWNPSHLFVGTQAENIADMKAKGRHKHVRPTPDDVAAIKASKKTIDATAQEFGVSPATIKRVRAGRWNA